MWEGWITEGMFGNGAKEMTIHIATIAAYPIKQEMGGGYRGVFFICTSK